MSVAQFPNPRRPEPFEPFSPAKWQGLDPPSFNWMVDGCFLRGTVAMLSGDGGLGKSLLMQQLCTAAALGKPWLGLATQKVKTFAMFCEDDEDELHRRQARINEHYGCDYGDLESTLYLSRVGLDTPLAELDKRTDTMRATEHYNQLLHAVTDFGAQIVVLDTVADVFWGDEIRRGQVRKFVTLLRRIAVRIQGCVILTAHPSVSGMASGTGLSGSTAWNNSVRARLYLTRASKASDEDQDAEERNERFLKTMKNNQGPYGDRVRLRWEDGVFQRADTVGAGFIERMEMDGKLIVALRRMVNNGMRPGCDPSAANGFANLVRKETDCKQYKWVVVKAAQERLIETGKMVRVELGPPSRRYVYLRTADTRLPGETEGETK